MLIPTLAGAVTSSRVPPSGWNCRVVGEVSIFLIWLGSAWLDILLNCLLRSTGEKRYRLFYWTLAKEFIVAAASIGWIMATVVGVYNRCDRWIGRDDDLILSQRPDVNSQLQHRLNVDFPAWIFSGVGVELVVIPALVWWKYKGALKTFVQRDDESSNVIWFWNILDGFRRVWQQDWWGGLKANMKRTLPRRWTNSLEMD